MQLEAPAYGVTFARLQQLPAYDLLLRLPLVGWSMLCATVQMAGFARYVREGNPGVSYGVNLAMRTSTIFFLLLLAAAVILRARPKDKALGLEPRVSAFLGAFLVYVIPHFPRRALAVEAEMVATMLILLGSAAAIVALGQLGRSFSMMSEARRLVTSGPYRFVRHPLYLAEELAVVGLLMQFLSIWTALVFAVQIAFQLRRMHNEEVVLAATFPEYATYRAKTARLIPGLY